MRKQDREAQIVAAAAELWARNGYHGTGVEELSQAVGLQRGALYHHIGSKEALLHEVCRRAITRLLDQTVDDSRSGPDDRLRALSRGLMEDIAAHQAEWTVFFREIAFLTGDRRDEIFALRDQYEKVWLAVIEDGAAEGVFRSADRLLVKGLLGMHNYSYLWFRPGGALTPSKVADIFTDALLQGLVHD